MHYLIINTQIETCLLFEKVLLYCQNSLVSAEESVYLLKILLYTVTESVVKSALSNFIITKL